MRYMLSNILRNFRTLFVAGLRFATQTSSALMAAPKCLYTQQSRCPNGGGAQNVLLRFLWSGHTQGRF